MVVYVYAGYPICAYLLSLITNRKVRKTDYQPMVSILIAAYNEEESIRATVENKLNLDYPEDKLEVIVISDESTDHTDQIVRKMNDQRIKLLRQQPRAGKTSALNIAVPATNGEILVFSDANSIYAPEALQKLVSCFGDPEVGYVTGKMIYTNPEGSPIGDGCSAYMKYENFLRHIETSLGSVIGVDGGIDAMRKNLYSSLRYDQLPDFAQPLKVVEKGYRVVYEPEAILKEASLKSSGDEYRMRVRVSLRALWALKDMCQLLLGSKGLLYAWQLWSHKLLRYGCFLFLLGAFFSNLFLWHAGQFYKVLLLLQGSFYTSALISFLFEKFGCQSTLLYPFQYFIILNIASGHAFIKFITGKKQVVWTPRKG
jgi:cellulose synthase/poly-beta-1,6-N-acetylglucosamine synthase-like glycosyltransferase